MNTRKMGRGVFTVLSAFACLLPSQGFSNSWLNKTQIDRVTVHDWGHAVFVYTSTPASNEGCGGGQNPLVLLRSNPQFKEIYAAALAASLARTMVGGFVYGCDPEHYNLPVLQRIDVLANPSATYP